MGVFIHHLGIDQFLLGGAGAGHADTRCCCRL
jgi:hypothetical protein